MALVNTGDQPVAVDLVRRDANGLETERHRLSESLAPNAKLVEIMDLVTADRPNEQISLETDGQVAVMFLRGSRAGSNFLYQTAPVRK